MAIGAAAAATAGKSGASLWSGGLMGGGQKNNWSQDLLNLMQIYGYFEDAPLRQTQRNLARLQERQARRFETEEKRVMGVKNVIGDQLSQYFAALRQ